MGGATAAGPITCAMARTAEEMGFDSLWFVDHLLYRDEGDAASRRAPGSAGRSWRRWRR